MTYFRACVNWPKNDVHSEGGLCDMIDTSRNVTRRTFLKHVDLSSEAELEHSLGYAPHDRESILYMVNDFAVSYHKSKLHGQTVYYILHSAIEYVFK